MSTESAKKTPAIIRDEAARQAIAQDYGGYIHHLPAGILRATSVEDVVDGVRYARRHGLKVAVRGAGHSTHGQAQVVDGLVIDLRTMNRVLEVTPDSILVEAGTQWRTVAQTALTIGRTFPVFTDYLATTVGGTLTVGGVGSRTWQLGTQTDHVLDLEVVTADGKVLHCSPECNADLFNAVRCGLGQFGIITKARLRLIPAPQHVHYHRALYGNYDTFWHELTRLVDEADYECIQGYALGNDAQSIVGHIGPDAIGFPLPTDAGPWLYCIETVKFLDQPADLSTTAPKRQAWLPGGYFAYDLPYLAYIDRLGPVEEMLKQLGLWQLPHPMLDVIIPGSKAQGFVRETLAALSPAEVAGPVLIYPYQRQHLRTPFFRTPNEERVLLFGLMRTTLPPTPDHVQAQVAENRRIYERAVAQGGCYYPIDSVPMTLTDWQQHFGAQWCAFTAAKEQFDPKYLLNPGQGIFAR
ncbi:MAG: FAD-binding protein [Caldilinea sp. CFX5]|nr:FAD-binding protein [Caldilinea sp. CFX5]